MRTIEVQLTNHAVERFKERTNGYETLEDIKMALDDLSVILNTVPRKKYYLNFPSISGQFPLERTGENNFKALTYKLYHRTSLGEEVNVFYQMPGNQEKQDV